jgi:tRNA pseudouridine55 synthase
VVDFFVRCSKGTYVRTLVHDFGRKIGCGAHLASLRRTRIGEFSVSDSRALDEICEMSREGIEASLVTSYLAKNLV